MKLAEQLIVGAVMILLAVVMTVREAALKKDIESLRGGLANTDKKVNILFRDFLETMEEVDKLRDKCKDCCPKTSCPCSKKRVFLTPSSPIRAITIHEGRVRVVYDDENGQRQEETLSEVEYNKIRGQAE